MRRARPATEASARPTRWERPVCLAGLFCAVWALVIQFSLPLALQLAPASQGIAYDLSAAATGRIHSGHGNDAGDHSLPVRAGADGILVKAESLALHGAAATAAEPHRPATAFRPSVRQHQVVHTETIHHSRLTRAPPRFGQVRQIV